MNWTYKGKELIDRPEDTYGFIYLITYTNGKKYVGQKKFYSEVNLPALKSGEQRPDSVRIGKNLNGKRVYFDKVKKPNNWKTYKGSSEHSLGLTIAHKEILLMVKLKKSLLYQEMKAIMCMGCLETEDYLNINILRKFYKGNI